MKLSVVRAYFSYLKAAGDLEINLADTKLVSLPAPPKDMTGRALTPDEVVRLLNAPDRSKPEGARGHALLLTAAFRRAAFEKDQLHGDAFRRVGSTRVLGLGPEPGG